MAKNLQYGRLQAVALQVVMWLVFGASLGLAAFIDHRRSSGLDVTLGEPLREGRLVVRVPEGWEVPIQRGPATDSGSARALTLIDFDRQGRKRRTLRITQEQQTGRPRGAEYYLEALISPQHQLPLEPQPFSMLGQDDGVIMPFKVDFRRIVGDTDIPGLPDPGVYACVVLPDGLAVTVQVTGNGAYGPSSRQLLQLVADNIRLADGVSATMPAR
jgi:hypothetical protein